MMNSIGEAMTLSRKVNIDHESICAEVMYLHVYIHIHIEVALTSIYMYVQLISRSSCVGMLSQRHSGTVLFQDRLEAFDVLERRTEDLAQHLEVGDGNMSLPL